MAHAIPVSARVWARKKSGRREDQAVREEISLDVEFGFRGFTRESNPASQDGWRLTVVGCELGSKLDFNQEPSIINLQSLWA